MKNYHDLLQNILDNGEDILNTRTNQICRTIIGTQLEYDVSKTFPCLTTRKMFFNGQKGELLSFFRGYDNAADFRALGCNLWNANANQTPAWLDNPARKGEDDCGRIYGVQWTRWSDKRVVKAKDIDAMKDKGYKVINYLYKEYAQTMVADALMEREINQLENALRTIITNPSDRRIIVSGWNPAELDLMCLPPCFTKDAIVSTPKGYINIDLIKEGDLVLSGTGTPRAVKNVWKTFYEGKMIELFVRYNNTPIKCTPNHPFLVKDKGWVLAGDIKEGDLVAIPKPKTKNDYTFNYSLNHGSGTILQKSHSLNEDDYFTLGYFLGNGWASKTDERICFAIPHKKKEMILSRIRKTIKVSKKPNSGINVSTYETMSCKWINLFREFGFDAFTKQIPEWIMTSSDLARKSFIDGYFEADGYLSEKDGFIATTVSPQLALGMQRLCTITNKALGITHQKRPPYTLIEGRIVNQKDTYSLRLAEKRNNYGTTFDDDYIWIPIKKINTYNDELNVYNLDVEEEHTYLVSNIVNHNCHIDYRFIPIEQTKELNVVMTIRSWDTYLGAPTNIVTTSLFLALMAKLSGYKPAKIIIQGANVHLYENSLEQTKELISRDHLELPTLKLSDNIRAVSVDEIEGVFERIEPDDIWLEGYESHAKLSVPMAA